jgi:hypothetical protein
MLNGKIQLNYSLIFSAIFENKYLDSVDIFPFYSVLLESYSLVLDDFFLLRDYHF